MRVICVRVLPQASPLVLGDGGVGCDRALGIAFDGIYPASSDIAYLRGYSQGLRHKLADIQRQALLLQQEGLAVENMFGDELEF